MARIHNLGFPRIGKQRELKFSLEKFWRGEISQDELLENAKELRAEHWQAQAECDLVPVGDFSFYDQVLDASFLFGVVPTRVSRLGVSDFDKYFINARGRSSTSKEAAKEACRHTTEAESSAGEMTKWFDTNYHYIKPELSAHTTFSLNSERLLEQLSEAQTQGVNSKVVLIGPVTYLWLSKSVDGTNALNHLPALLDCYSELLKQLASKNVDWVQLDEPILSTELAADWKAALKQSYDALAKSPVKILLANYFGALEDNLDLVCALPMQGLHVDAINGRNEVDTIINKLPQNVTLSLGVIDGRNIWASDLDSILDWLSPLAERLQEKLWIAPSCSLLHVPVDLESETKLESAIKGGLAFAIQKLKELSILKRALNNGRASVSVELAKNNAALNAFRKHKGVKIDEVRQATQAITEALGQRKAPFAERKKLQAKEFNLPSFPTTVIGSFPQTPDIRKARKAFKKNAISPNDYTSIMKKEIARCVSEQERIGLDVLVHGEAERNDMVEYFGEQLGGFTFSQNGWVQSYGSRCVKPPILFGDVYRKAPMTIDWIRYAQSLTDKPMKGMLTGPVTILNWSFVRTDQPRSETCRQIALAIRDEVLDLEKAGVSIIQIDEAALREGLPLRQSNWKHYLDWAIESFRLTANGVDNQTQIHTHMCYSNFNDIFDAIVKMDADVITIETSRSDMKLLDVFDTHQYPNDIGPGVYDIHSPNTPSVEQIVGLMDKAAQRVPSEQLWVNPDCGLKTRRWNEVVPALENMVAAAKALREEAVKSAA